MADTSTQLFYFVCGDNNELDYERFKKYCEKVFEERKNFPGQRIEIIIMEA